MHNNPLYLVGDFETTVTGDGQRDTEVWASACVQMNSEDVLIFHSIGDTFEYLKSLNTNVVIYYHNLKFDGSFWLSYFLKDLKLQQAYRPLNAEEKLELLSTFEGSPFKPSEIDDEVYIKWKKDGQMRNNQVKYAISDKGQWYNIKVKINNHIIEMRDSLKLLPFSVKKLGKGFNTKHRKLEMEYKGDRYAGCPITEEERKYIANDVLVVKEALEFMFSEDHKRVTIGSCCLEEYKKVSKNELDYAEYFPNLYGIPLDPMLYGSKSAGDYIRKSYKGGWCYVVKGKECKRYTNGTTADVNSLYPSMMHSESGNRFPSHKPTFFHGHEACRKELEYLDNMSRFMGIQKYYFIRLRSRFYLKEDHLPCIQIKGNVAYNPTEWLATSDYKGRDGKYYTHYYDEQGRLIEAKPTLTLTQTDFLLIRDHYHLVDLELLDGCWFPSDIGIFDSYIDKYKGIKMASTGAMRELAKLFLNNLYGKMAASTDSSFKVARLKDDGSLGFITVVEHEKKPGFIPVGSAITSYARNFTIRAAQSNYHGVDQPGFIYADTDSIHCDLPPDKLRGIKVDTVNFCCWKLEACWDEGWFTRQKTYIEHVTHVDLNPIEEPYYNVKCAGMPERAKDLFVKSITGYQINETDEFTEAERDVINRHLSLEDFNIGLTLPGKLLPKQIPGGILLVETTYKMW